jgi:hypothetical protein
MREPTESAPDLATARAAFCQSQEDVWKLEAAEHAAWRNYLDSGQAPEAHSAFRRADWALQLAQDTLNQARAAYRAAVLAAESEGR